MKMEELPPSKKSEQEKNSRTVTTTKEGPGRSELKVLNFAKKDNKAEAREDLLDLLGVAASDLQNGIDFDVMNATTGIVILANPDADEGNNSLVTVYTTKTNPMKILGILEFVKIQITEQNSY